MDKLKIVLEDNELKTAIANHITSLGFNLKEYDYDIIISQGRGVNGDTATIEVKEKITGSHDNIITSQSFEEFEEDEEDTSENTSEDTSEISSDYQEDMFE